MIDTSSGGSLLQEVKELVKPRVVIGDFDGATCIEKRSSSDSVCDPVPDEKSSGSDQGLDGGDLPHLGNLSLPELLHTNDISVFDKYMLAETSLGHGSTSGEELLPERKPKPWGVLVVSIHGAKNVKKVSQPNTFVGVEFENEERYTKLAIDSENPEWGEVFTFLVNEAPTCESRVTITLYKRTKKLYYVIGYSNHFTKEVIRQKHINQWHQLYSFRDVNPKVHLELQFQKPTEALLVGEPACDANLYTPSGLLLPDEGKDGSTLIVIVHEAKGLSKKYPQIIHLSLPEYSGELIYTTRKVSSFSTLWKRAKKWVWEQEFKFALEEAPLDFHLLVENGNAYYSTFKVYLDFFISLTDVVINKQIDKWYQPSKIHLVSCEEAKLHIEMKWIPDEPIYDCGKIHEGPSSSFGGDLVLAATLSGEGLMHNAEGKPILLGLLLVTIHGATNVRRVRQPNAYADIVFGKEERYTKLAIGNKNPDWDEVFTFLVNEAAADNCLYIRLYYTNKNGYYEIGWHGQILKEVIEKKHINESHELNATMDLKPKIHFELQYCTVKAGQALGEIASSRSLYRPEVLLLPDDDKDGGKLLVIVHTAKNLGNKDMVKYVQLCLLEYRVSNLTCGAISTPWGTWDWEEKFEFVLGKEPLDYHLKLTIETDCGNRSPEHYISLKDLAKNKHINKRYRPSSVYCCCCAEANIRIEMKWIPDNPV